MRILIPTDFSESSIELLEKINITFTEDTEVLFTHLFYLPFGIQDMLFDTYRLREYDFITFEFSEAYARFCKDRKQDSKEEKIPVRFFYGNTMAFFKNFIAANKIDIIAYSARNPVKKLNSSSIDCNSILKKSGLNLLNVDYLKNTQTTNYATQK